jgi:hypothetical protein
MTRRVAWSVAAALALAAAPARADVPVSLRGSPESMVRQHRVAVEQGYRFVRTPAEMRRMERAGELVRLPGNRDYALRSGVSGVARAEVRVFLERLAAGYRAACREQLVVTSTTRAVTRQPPNAHPLSVHPAGIAVDLRVSGRAACRRWLEGRLLALERDGILDVTREAHPPHYHVALFPEPYRAYLERTAGIEAAVQAGAGLPRLPLPREEPAGDVPLPAPGATVAGPRVGRRRAGAR